LYSGWAEEGYVQGYLHPRPPELQYTGRKLTDKVKRALRALESPAYTKARTKNSVLPEVTDAASAENAFKLLPLSLLALRVTKVDPHAGHDHGKPTNRVKGLWTVRIEQHQDAEPLHHYVWLYEGPQWKQKAMAAGVVAAIFAVVLFPLWPMVLRQGVWYLSVGMMGLLGLFFAMALFRLVLFCVTVFAVPPGLWLFPNLFEDVGVIDSFKPLWGWQEVSPSSLGVYEHLLIGSAEQEEEEDGQDGSRSWERGFWRRTYGDVFRHARRFRRCQAQSGAPGRRSSGVICAVDLPCALSFYLYSHRAS
jgi:protein translocation Sec62 family protein